jgi:hypothetical protein
MRFSSSFIVPFLLLERRALRSSPAPLAETPGRPAALALGVRELGSRLFSTEAHLPGFRPGGDVLHRILEQLQDELAEM